MQKVIISILTSVLLTGCTVPLLPDLSANLARANDNLRKVNYSLRNTPGGSRTVTAEANEKVCDPQAFQAGFTDQYVLNWNKEVGMQEAHYRFLLRNHPNDPAARHNYAIYQNQLLSSKGTGNAMKYGLSMDSQGRIRNPCQSGSYTQGESAGLQAVANDLKALSEQEIERRYE